jgi:hypothetical protein
LFFADEVIKEISHQQPVVIYARIAIERSYFRICHLLIPSMPFKAGNTVKAGDLLGKVEAITFLNTRMRTFDGKTFFVPNRQVPNDIVINYHFTQTRRVKVDVSIRYDQDLLKAKRVLEMVMTEDARVKTKPGPMVYVLNLVAGLVELGGRCWVDNNDYWVARCELLEKTKLRFDQEGIRFAFPQLDLHLNPGEAMEGQGACSVAVSNNGVDRQAEPDEMILMQGPGNPHGLSRLQSSFGRRSAFGGTGHGLAQKEIHKGRQKPRLFPVEGDKL